MKNSIYKLIEKATGESVNSRLKQYAEMNDLAIGEGADQVTGEEVVNRLEKAEEFLYAQFTGKNFAGEEYRNLPTLNFKEALNTSDASILFPRVFSDILQEPTEPALFMTNMMTETIRLPDKAPLFIEFPTVDALQAFDMAEGQEYTAQTLSFGQHMISMRIGKIGAAAAMNEEIINQSMWPIVEMHMRMLNNAVNRKTESNLFTALTNRAQTVFDNENASTDYHTTGKAIVVSGTVNNGSFSYHDLVKMMGVMLGNRFTPTHFLAHPLTWPIFAQDPIMRAQFYHLGQLGQGIWNREPSFDQQANMPFGITYVPYYALDYNEADTLTGILSGYGSSLTSDLYLVDSKNALMMATRGNTEMDQMENWFRDATMMKIRRYLGISVKFGGKGILKAANIRVVKNEEPIHTIKTLSA